MADLQKLELITEEYISQKNTDAAVKGLYDLIVCYAKAKNFTKAHELRERLMEIDNLALTEIVTSAEVIEAEKTASIDKKHREIWKDLYTLLTKEEANALYHSLEKIDLDPDQTILSQGSANNKLFFIDAGTLKVTFKTENALEFVKEIGPGEPAGHDTFFPISLCTTSATTSGGVQIKYLQRAHFDIISEQVPGLAQKLESFCRTKEGVPLEVILQNKDLERRQQKRIPCTGKVHTQLLDSAGNALSKPFIGFIDDISNGGISFSIKCSQKSAARMLLGRPAILTIREPVIGLSTQHEYSCQIVCVKSQLFTDYSVHVRFDKALTIEDMTDLDISEDTIWKS